MDWKPPYQNHYTKITHILKNLHPRDLGTLKARGKTTWSPHNAQDNEQPLFPPEDVRF
jgi:hypothetical protein